jgi:hypothetical protein
MLDKKNILSILNINARYVWKIVSINIKHIIIIVFQYLASKFDIYNTFKEFWSPF